MRSLERDDRSEGRVPDRDAELRLMEVTLDEESQLTLLQEQ